ncbi:RNA-directed DNA polymerase, eukaryota [Tanacetum coccineum]|uniref:RNA-directed DNA polymerase, eukaryota n=1 Tax=Tanacetum coccineum TaxID=301880 RepID=A0ABQ5INP1_9ASTR
MACSLPHTLDEIQALVQKLLDEDIVRQNMIMELAVKFDNASTAKDDLRKAYEKCNDIPQESPVKWFFDHGDFAIGCNSSFVALIPKVLDLKVVSDYRPISLIGSLYKVVTKILASRLSLVISDLISDVQTAFLPNRQILDGPFIINEILVRCKLKKQQAMIFKVDFAKAYDSVRWDYLDDVLISFGFGPKWRSWIRGSLSSGKASILVNGSPTTEFHLYRGLKQGDPLAPFLFLLIMESLHLSFSRAVEAGIFKGYKIDPSTTLSHLFYADDAVFIGEWSHSNLKGIMNILRCFSLLSGMSINIQKSHLLGVGIPDNCVAEAAKSIGCLIMKAPFKYLGILVGDNMSSKKAWDETINKMKKRLSRWKLNTLSVGGRLTLLKSVLGSTPIYNMSIFKVPKSVLNYMESLRRNFFNGFQEGDRKIAWVKWSKVLASKKFGGLGVSSFFALNRALLFKWVWRYLSHDNSLWSRIISALHGLNGHVLSAAFNSTWSSIITEVNSLKVKGVDLISHCKIRVGKGTGTSFWKDLWIGDNLLKLSFPRLFALEENKDISVADKMNTSISSSFRRHVRGGVESQQLDQLSLLLDTVILSNMDDRWFWDLNGDGVFQVKDVRSMLDEAFLPKMEVPTRWIKSIPIKVNVFAWKLYLDRLPTRSNLSRRNVSLPSLACPLCDHVLEDSSHLFFGCSVAKDIQKLICRWWNLDVHPYESYEDWLSWFKSIRLGSKTKEVLEGVFYVSWWSLWNFRNQFLFASPIPRKDAIFDNIVLRSFYCSLLVVLIKSPFKKKSGDNLLKLSFPRLFALEENKDISVADKMNTSISSSFRRHVRGGVESQQLDQLSLLLDTVILSNMDDRWFWDLNGDGVFQVKDVRSMLDEAFLPKMEVPTRWIKSIPIKVNVFAWKLYLDRLPTRSNLSRRNVSLPSLACPLCDHVLEDSSHLFFGCSVAKDIQKLICRWWNLDVHPYESYEDWLSWFKSIHLGSKTKEVLEGVFYVSWWSLWNFRNQFLFAAPIPRNDAIFDNIVLRSFYWCVARCNRTLNLVSWLQHPFLIPL